jgi:hypothetical protein
MMISRIQCVLSLFITISLVSPSTSKLSENPTHELKAEWTTPLQEGDKVPDVTFLTRVRIESDEENPFDWKCK